MPGSPRGSSSPAGVGPFTLEPIDRAQDKYGLALFVVTQGGESVGGALVREGLAEEWRGWRREFC